MAPCCTNNGSAGDNCDNTTAIDYNLSDFVHQFYTASLRAACPLCGTVHTGRIHYYVDRKYRDRESGGNITIILPVIICLTARARGKQYTKRLLPDFLTPHSVIRLDHLLEAADLPESDRTEAAVCDLLGCLDPRTARYHMRRLTTAIQAVSLDLARRRAATPELGELPDISPETSCGERLRILFDAECRAGERMGEPARSPPMRQLLQAAMCRHLGKKPSNHASPPGRPP